MKTCLLMQLLYEEDEQHASYDSCPCFIKTIFRRKEQCFEIVGLNLFHNDDAHNHYTNSTSNNNNKKKRRRMFTSTYMINQPHLAQAADNAKGLAKGLSSSYENQNLNNEKPTPNMRARYIRTEQKINRSREYLSFFYLVKFFNSTITIIKYYCKRSLMMIFFLILQICTFTYLSQGMAFYCQE